MTLHLASAYFPIKKSDDIDDGNGACSPGPSMLFIYNVIRGVIVADYDDSRVPRSN